MKHQLIGTDGRIVDVLDNWPNHCPKCGDEYPSYDSVDIGVEYATQYANCGTCGASWEEFYRADHIVIHENGDGMPASAKREA